MLSVPRVAFIIGFSVPWGLAAPVGGWKVDGFHVFPGEQIQDALDAASRNPTNKVVKVHAGLYGPDTPRQALIWFNRSHDGIRLEALGQVTLTAANPDLTDRASPAHPAAVNHVVYFGDGISARTTLQGFRITGANHFVTTSSPEVESNGALKKNLFFYSDGGAVKIFGRSYPILRGLEIIDNYASPCAGGISVQHEAEGEASLSQSVRIEDCVFHMNRSQITGAAIDLLPGSSAVISNCLFVGNVANLGIDYVSANKPGFTNSAPLTVFPNCRALVQRCTFTGNRNGADDLGRDSVYQSCVFWRNDLGGAFYNGERYELDIEDRALVIGCIFSGPVINPRGLAPKADNVFNAEDPKFDSRFRPRSPQYSNAGFRPGTNQLFSIYSPPKPL